jgi:hypothetical protein
MLPADADRCRSWFAWGASGIAAFLYPASGFYLTAASSSSASGKAAAYPNKVGSSSSTAASAAAAAVAAGPSMPSEAELEELLLLLQGKQLGEGAAGKAAASPAAAAAASVSHDSVSAAAAAAAPAQPMLALSLDWQLLRLRAVLHDCQSPSVRKELMVVDLEGTHIKGTLADTRLSVELQLQDVRLFDCCSDPGVHECVLQRLDPGSPVASVGAVLLSSSHGWGCGLTGLSLIQGSGLHRLSPEAFGWDAGTALPVVSSRSSARASAATAAGVKSGSGLDAGAGRSSSKASAGGHDVAGRGRPLKQPLLCIGVEVEGKYKSVSVQLQQLQLLARPGCVVGLQSMLQQLPSDTLQQHLAKAAAEIAAQQAASLWLSPCPDVPASSAAAGPPGRHAIPRRQRSVHFTDAGCGGSPVAVARMSARQTSEVQLPAALLQVQFSFTLQELLVVVPTELHYAAGLNAVLHLQGLKLRPAAAAAAAADTAAAAAAAQCPSFDGTADTLFADMDGVAVGGSTVNDAGTAAASSGDANVPPGYGNSSSTSAVKLEQPQQQLQKQQKQQKLYSLELASSCVSVQLPEAAAASTVSRPRVGRGAGNSHQNLLELLKLPPVQGSITLSGLPAADAPPKDGSKLQHQPHKQHQLPLVQVAVQMPPVKAVLATRLLLAVMKVKTLLLHQLKLPLEALVACYSLDCDMQQAAVAAWQQRQQQPQNQPCQQQQQQQHQEVSEVHVVSLNPAGDALDDGQPPSPTDSEVLRWMSAPAALYSAALPAAASLGNASLGLAGQQLVADRFLNHHQQQQQQQQLAHQGQQGASPVVPSSGHVDILLGSSTGSSASGSSATVVGTRDQQLRRCDSDSMMHAAVASTLQLQEQEQQQQQQQQQQQEACQGVVNTPAPVAAITAEAAAAAAAAAAALAGPDLQLLDLVMLVEDLDIEYIDDKQQQQQQQQQQAPPTNSCSSGRGTPHLHLQLQLGLLTLKFRHSSHGSKAELCANNLFYDDKLVLPSPALAATAPDQLIVPPCLAHILQAASCEGLQLLWQSRPKLWGVDHQLQMAAQGLQAVVSFPGLQHQLAARVCLCAISRLFYKLGSQS